MFLNEKAQSLIKDLRGVEGDVNDYKASICDAMSIIIFMYQMYAKSAKSEHEKLSLIDAIDTLSNYNELITELSKEK